jgi:hypothetical protein
MKIHTVNMNLKWRLGTGIRFSVTATWTTRHSLKRDQRLKEESVGGGGAE